MNCVLCLKIPLNLSEVLDINSAEGQLLGVQNVIQKHFWLEDSDISDTPTVCHGCWNSLFAFHQFYLRVQSAHDILKSKRKEEVTNPLEIALDISTCPDVKIETENIKLEPDIAKDESLPKKRRGRPRKHPVPPVEIESPSMSTNEANGDFEVNFDDIKNEILQENFVNINDVICSDNSISTSSTALDDREFNEESGPEPEQEILRSKRRKRSKHTSSKRTKPAALNDQTFKDHGNKSGKSKKNDEFIAENFKLNCCLCNVSLANFSVLKVHFRKEHKTRGYAMCCNKRFPKRGVLVDHLHMHLDPQYFKCPLCEKLMSSRRCLELHTKNHEQSRERIYQCEVCSKSFFRHNIFLRHTLLHVPAEEKKVQCPKCNKTFATKYVMEQHLKLTHLNLYAKICDICGKSIRGKEALRLHLEEHAGVEREPIQCNICGVTLTNKYGLTRHMKMRHTEENLRPQVCPICAKTSPNMAAHKRHIQFMHLNERKHACTLCDKAFKRPMDLREHMTTHTGEVLYTCPHCPKTFNSNANMHSHRKKMHRKEWEEKRRERLQQVKGLSEKSDIPNCLQSDFGD